jgi:competence protein ComEC
MTGIAAGLGVLTGAALGWWGAVAVLAGSVIIVTGRFSQAASMVCAVAIVASVAGAWRVETAGTPVEVLAPNQIEVATVVSDPVRTGQRQLFAAEARSEDRQYRAAPPTRICVSAPPVPEARLGDLVGLDGDSRALSDVPLAYRSRLRTLGCSVSVFAESMVVTAAGLDLARALGELRDRLGRSLRAAAPGDAGVLLSGLVTGDDERFSAATEAAFERSSTTHLTAVSGSNLALVAGILATVGAMTVGGRRRTWLAVTLAGVWAYALVSGLQPPALRAAIVISVALFAFLVGRAPDYPTLILLAAGAMVLLDPRHIESLGFQLSVAASLTLAFVLPEMLSTGWSSRVAALLVASVAAQLATLPILLPIFGTFSLWSLPANVIAAPLVAVAMPLAALASVTGLVSSPLGEAIAAPAALAAMLLIRIVGALGAEGSNVKVGQPPAHVTLVIAATAILILAAMASDMQNRPSRTCMRAGITRRCYILDPAAARSGPEPTSIERAVVHAEGPTTKLPPAALSILGREDPLHTFAADANDAVDDPAAEQH